MATYLEFEEPIKLLEEQITQAKEISSNTGVDMSDNIKQLQKNLTDKTKEIISNLTPWQRVQLSRHPDFRPDPTNSWMGGLSVETVLNACGELLSETGRN